MRGISPLPNFQRIVFLINLAVIKLLRKISRKSCSGDSYVYPLISVSALLQLFVCYINWYHTPYISYFFVCYRIFRMAIIQRSFSTRYH